LVVYVHKEIRVENILACEIVIYNWLSPFLMGINIRVINPCPSIVK